jgi:hypothetical protein
MRERSIFKRIKTRRAIFPPASVLTGLDPLSTYYIAATAYNTAGIESDFSNEGTFTAN